MCGIAGIFRVDGLAADRDTLSQMAGMQRHRGPDDQGLFLAGNVGLAFRRLAILDLTPTGHQPMASADGMLWIVFNGEIYNHKELRVELEGHGHCFRSSSDTEVILASYRQWGPDCLSRFNGMWAFAIWDSSRQCLFCARDRFGVKPFYYHWDGRRFLFASEIKALLVDPTVSRRANERSVQSYLVFGGVRFGEETFFEEIRELSPAHYMLVDGQGVTTHRYWQLDHRKYSLATQDEDAIEGLRALLFDSVRLRLQSDVPVGTCLSGGLDSSTIVCIANRILFDCEQRPERTVVGDRQKTFSACYADKRYDERLYMDAVIAQTGAQAHQVFPDAEGLFAELEEFIWHQDEPVPGTSMYAQWCVMRCAREAGVTVLLDGQGGDEVAGGYQSYYWAYIAGEIRSMHLRAVQQSVVGGCGTHSRLTQGDILGILYAGLPIVSQDLVKFVGKRMAAQSWIGPAFGSWWHLSQRRSTHPTWLGQALERDLLYDSLPALLKYEDRNSMAHSIEARVPFLDYRLVEFMAALPDRMKVRNGQMKWLLRQAINGLVPEQVRQRQDKMGFGTPQVEWLAGRSEQVEALTVNGEISRRGWVNASRLAHYVSTRNVSGRVDARLLWRWLNLELWLRKFKVT